MIKTNYNKQKIILVILFAALLVAVFPVFAQKISNELDLGWYSVQEWEWDECNKWGGSYQTTSGGENSPEILNISKYFTSSLIVTLQAELLKVTPTNLTLPDNTKVYAISWYVQPVSGSVNYQVRIAGQITPVAATSATLDAPGIGYEVIQTAEPIRYVTLTVENGPEWTVPIVS